MNYDQQQTGYRLSMEHGSLQEFAKLLLVGAAALRCLIGNNPNISPAVDESLETILEIASTLDKVGETLRAQSIF